MSRQNDQSVYAAAQGRSFLAGELEGRPNEYIREFAGLVDDRETLDLLDYYCGLWQDRGEDFLETRMAEIILSNAATHMADSAFRAGNVSQLQGMVGLRNTGDGDAGDVLAELASRLSQEGTVAIVVGPPGAGKTATTLDVARATVARTGGYMIGNTGWDAYDATVKSDREMLDYMGSREGPVLGVIDEAAQVLTSRGAQAQDVDDFAASLKFVRKKESGDDYPKRGSVLMVGHTLKDTGAELRRLATLVIQKPSRNDPGRVRLLESEGGRDDFDEVGEYTGLTDTRENYPEHEASSFEIVGTDDDGEDGEDVPEPDDVRREEAIATVLRATAPWDEDGGLTYKDAAGLVDYSPAWVSARVSEWRDGEHHDLVNAPGGGTE